MLPSWAGVSLLWVPRSIVCVLQSTQFLQRAAMVPYRSVCSEYLFLGTGATREGQASERSAGDSDCILLLPFRIASCD